MKDEPEMNSASLADTPPGLVSTSPFVRTAALFASTSQAVNWTTSSAPVQPRQAVARCVRCGGRVVGRFESDYSCINCGRYPLDYGADETWSAYPARMVRA